MLDVLVNLRSLDQRLMYRAQRGNDVFREKISTSSFYKRLRRIRLEFLGHTMRKKGLKKLRNTEHIEGQMDCGAASYLPDKLVLVDNATAVRSTVKRQTLLRATMHR